MYHSIPQLTDLTRTDFSSTGFGSWDTERQSKNGSTALLLTMRKHRLVKMASTHLTDDLLYEHQATLQQEVASLTKELTYKNTGRRQQRKIAALTQQHPTLASGNSRTLILAHFIIGP